MCWAWFKGLPHHTGVGFMSSGSKSGPSNLIRGHPRGAYTDAFPLAGLDLLVPPVFSCHHVTSQGRHLPSSIPSSSLDLFPCVISQHHHNFGHPSAPTNTLLCQSELCYSFRPCFLQFSLCSPCWKLPETSVESLSWPEPRSGFKDRRANRNIGIHKH